MSSSFSPITAPPKPTHLTDYNDFMHKKLNFPWHVQGHHHGRNSLPSTISHPDSGLPISCTPCFQSPSVPSSPNDPSFLPKPHASPLAWKLRTLPVSVRSSPGTPQQSFPRSQISALTTFHVTIPNPFSSLFLSSKKWFASVIWLTSFLLSEMLIF